MDLAIVPAVKTQKPPDLDAMIYAYWLLYCRAPGRKTAPGEAVDLGEIGSVPDGKTFDRWCPYSIARPN